MTGINGTWSLGKIVQQGHGRAARGAVGDDPGIILDAGAVAQLLHHLNVIVRPLPDALGLQQLVVGLEPGDPIVALGADALNGGGRLLPGGHVVTGRVDGHVIEHPGGSAGDHVDLADAVHLVPEKLHADGPVVGIGGKDLHRVSPDAELVAFKGQVVALVADLDELPQQLVEIPGLTGAQGDHHVGVVDGVPQAVDAGDGGHHDHVPLSLTAV